MELLYRGVHELLRNEYSFKSVTSMVMGGRSMGIH